MTQLRRDAKVALADASETPTESNASKSCTPELVYEAADSQAAAKPQVDIDASSIAASHAKKAKLQQQLQNVERQDTLVHSANKAAHLMNEYSQHLRW